MRENGDMARGWESKSVESQQESSQSEGGPSSPNELSAEAAQALRKRECLRLSRTRILHDLDGCTHERYRRQLNEALAHIERELAAGR